MAETTAVHIGAKVDKQSAAEFRTGIKLILDSNVGDLVKTAAIDALIRQYAVNNVSLSNCNIEMGARK